MDGVRVLHYFPGRLRVRVVRLKNAPELSRRVEQELSCVPGVRRVVARHTTGSVLLEYDRALVRSREAAEVLLEAARRLLHPSDVSKLESYLDRLRSRNPAGRETQHKT